jgi:hypothetical protein
LYPASKLAGLPSGYRPEEDTSQEARRFDLLALQLQLAVRCSKGLQARTSNIEPTQDREPEAETEAAHR